MIWLWNRKKLFVGSDAQEAARVWSTLQANHIPYSLTTKGMEPTMVRGFHANMAAGATKGAARYSDVTRPMNLLYTIYVRKGDYEEARKLLSYHPE